MTSASPEEVARPVRDPLTSTRIGLFHFDVPSRRLLCLNEAAQQLHNDGLPLAPEDAPPLALRTLEGNAVSAAHLPSTIAAREGRPAEAEFLLVRPGLPARYLHWSTAPLHDAAGRVAAVLISITDSPPPPDWEALAGLAHDLRTPLHSVGLLLGLLGQQAVDEAQRAETLRLLRSAAERARQVGQDLLEWCRAAGARGRPVQPAWFPLEPVLHEMLAEQRLDAERKGLTLTGELTSVLGWQVHTDRVRLGRVLANLLANAIRYTPAGGRVVLKASWENRIDERFLVLEVVDTGAGVSAEERESIFHPFERGVSGRESGSSGSGIGLSVVDRLTQELGLRRELTSDLGRGSAFRVLVPLPLLCLVAPTLPPSARP
jgi:hypothetical protein